MHPPLALTTRIGAVEIVTRSVAPPPFTAHALEEYGRTVREGRRALKPYRLVVRERGKVIRIHGFTLRDHAVRSHRALVAKYTNDTQYTLPSTPDAA